MARPATVAPEIGGMIGKLRAVLDSLANLSRLASESMVAPAGSSPKTDAPNNGLSERAFSSQIGDLYRLNESSVEFLSTTTPKSTSSATNAPELSNSTEDDDDDSSDSDDNEPAREASTRAPPTKAPRKRFTTTTTTTTPPPITETTTAYPSTSVAPPEAIRTTRGNGATSISDFLEPMNRLGPMVVASPNGCKENGRHYAIGEQIPTTERCRHCYCGLEGLKECKMIDCSLRVAHNCIPITPEGHCCPIRYECPGNSTSTVTTNGQAARQRFRSETDVSGGSGTSGKLQELGGASPFAGVTQCKSSSGSDDCSSADTNPTITTPMTSTTPGSTDTGGGLAIGLEDIRGLSVDDGNNGRAVSYDDTSSLVGARPGPLDQIPLLNASHNNTNQPQFTGRQVSS